MGNNDTTVAVLGLGRIGRAMSEYLSVAGFAVTGWSRSGVTVSGVRSARECDAAVADADVVVLALYDAPACHDVLDQCLGAVSEDCVVVNAATVGPDEARALEARATAAQRTYLHCPIMGSAPAVRSGSLVLLAGSADVSGATGEVLKALGDVTVCHDASTAASLKLLANSVLAGSTLQLGEALGRARRLGLDTGLALDVLERTTLGRLVSSKRPRLTGVTDPADFTAGALRKDIRLLADTDTASVDLLAMLSAANVGDDADIADVSTALSDSAAEPIDRDSNLAAMPWVTRDSTLLAPLVNYARGHATGSPHHLRAAFRPSAHIEGIRDQEFASWDLDAYCNKFPGHAAEDEESRTRTITDLRRFASIATATMVLEHGPDRFADLFLLVEEHGAWRIANKVYHRDARSPDTSPANASSVGSGRGKVN